jgi:hypothetical protein
MNELEINSDLTWSELRVNYESWINIHKNEFHLLCESGVHDIYGKNYLFCSSLICVLTKFTNPCIYFGLKTIWKHFVKKHIFHIKEFLNEFFCKLLFIIFTIAPICHRFYVNHFSMDMIFLNDKICWILRFILKHDHNFI